MAARVRVFEEVQGGEEKSHKKCVRKCTGKVREIVVEAQ